MPESGAGLRAAETLSEYVLRSKGFAFNERQGQVRANPVRSVAYDAGQQAGRQRRGSVRRTWSHRGSAWKGETMRTKMVLLAAATVAISTLTWAQAGSSSDIKPVPQTGSLNSYSGTKFTFMVAGDNRPASADLPQPPIAATVFQAAKTQGAAFAVWTGDIIYGLDSADPKAIGKQYDAFFNLAATAGVPVFNAPGNHEMDVKVKHNKDLKETGSQEMEKLYRDNMGIAKDGNIYGAFSYGNARFILLNTEEVPPEDVTRSPGAVVGASNNMEAKGQGGKVNLDPGYISKDQRKWLESELNSDKKMTHVFIFMHHPIKPEKSDMGLNKKDADDLVSLFQNYSNISYVFASHEHLYYNPQTKDTSQPPSRTDPSQDPPYYLVSGGAGAPLSQGGVYNYLVVSVDGNNITAKMVPVQ